MTCLCACTPAGIDERSVDGHTYERVEIERWFEKSDISPMSNEQLDSKNLIPNTSLKHYIEMWKRQNQGKTLSIA